MRILCIIPARGGSKGVPGKNIKLLNGKPLLSYTAEAALQSKYFTKVILSSEDQAIIDVAKNIGLEVPFVRPEELAADDSPTIDVVSHALEWFKERSVFFDAVCILQVTCPFRTVGFLEHAILKFMEGGYDSLVSVQKVPDKFNPHWTFKLEENGSLKLATGEANIISTRQDLPHAFYRDGSIYLTKTEVILKMHSLYGNSVGYVISPEGHNINIDTQEDWKQAEKILEKEHKG